MKKNSVSKRITAFLMAVVLVVSTITVRNVSDGNKAKAESAGNKTVPAVQDASSAVNYATILGRATDFGILAKFFDQRDHMESTFAVGTFRRTTGSPSTIDLIPKGSTAQFLIGAVDKTSPSSPVVWVDGDVPGTMNFEADPDVMLNYHKVNDGYAGDYIKVQTKSNVLGISNSGTKANIDSMIKNVYETSKEIQDKIDDGYAIDYNEYSAIVGSKIHLNLNEAQFKNKVVYIDVDKNLLSYMNASDGLFINKDSSTIVVFNFSDGCIDDELIDNPNYDPNDSNSPKKIAVKPQMVINKFQVSIDGGQTWHDTTKYASSDISNGGLAFTDKEICQKLIFNFRVENEIGLHNTSGLFIAPFSKHVRVLSTSAGWVVADYFSNDNGEWHYIYNGGNQEVQKDGVGQIHFAARKSFTHKDDITADSSVDDVNGKTDTIYKVVEDTSIYTEAGEYVFSFTETDKNFNPKPAGPGAGGPGATAKGPYDSDNIYNQATNTIKFPTISFYTPERKAEAEAAGAKDYVIENGSDKTKSFYYVIKETGNDKDGITRSNGQINIRLDVTNNDGVFSYVVYSWTYLGDFLGDG